MFNWSKNPINRPVKKRDEATLALRQALKELEAQVPEIRMKLMTEPEEASPLCNQILEKLYELKATVTQWEEKERHRRDVLEMSLLNFLGQSQEDSGNWEQATATYERCFSLGAQLQLPDFQVVSLGHLGKAYRHAGNLVLAAQSFDRAVVLCQEVGLAPQEAEALYERAVVAELQGQPQEALHAYREGLNLSEGERLYELAVRFLSQLGQLQQGLGEYTSAIEYYEACLKFLRETDNDRESETIILGQISHICVQIEDFERGLKAAEQGLENSRQTKQTAEEAAFLNDLSRIYLGKGNFEQARHYANQARLIAQQRRDHQALKDAEQLLSQLERGPDNVEEVPFSFRTMSGSIQTPEVHYQRGNLYYHEGALDRAIASYSRAINLNPKLTPAYINRGSVYTAKGYYDRALADYNRALELEPNDPVCFFNRGNVYRKRREYLRALSDYSEAIRLDPTDPDSYFNRGEVLRRMKLNLEAAADFQRVIKLSTGRDEAGVAQARRLLNELGKS